MQCHVHLPQISLREKLFFRMIYGTTCQPREVLKARIELWNRTTGEITFPGQSRVQPLDQAPHSGCVQKHEADPAHFEKMIERRARPLNLQKKSVHRAIRQDVVRTC